jgi:hypothetical protein
MVDSHLKGIPGRPSAAPPVLSVSDLGVAELRKFLTSQGIVKDLDLPKLSAILSSMSWLPDVEN